MASYPSSNRQSDRQMGLRVLIVEDQPDVAANIWDFLERRGYVVDHAADGEAGLSRACWRGRVWCSTWTLAPPRLADLFRLLRRSCRCVSVLSAPPATRWTTMLRGSAAGRRRLHGQALALNELEPHPRPSTVPGGAANNLSRLAN